MIPDRFQYFLYDFWNFEKWPNLGPRIAYLSPKDFKRYKKNMGTSFKHIIISENQEFRKLSFFEGYRHHLFVYCFVLFRLPWTMSIYCLYKFVKMRIGKWYNFYKKHLQQLGYEFHSYQKTWTGNVANPIIFSIFK